MKFAPGMLVVDAVETALVLRGHPNSDEVIVLDLETTPVAPRPYTKRFLKEFYDERRHTVIKGRN